MKTTLLPEGLLCTFIFKSFTMNHDQIKPGQEEEPLFSLPVENEILMLKLNAEFGASCSGSDTAVPPKVVNEFLKSVYAFETAFSRSAATIAVYDRIGRPAFRPAAELTDEEISAELERIESLMARHHIALDVLGQYSQRLMYNFLTEEFFRHEMDDIDLPRFTHHFCYEEFHPNHEMDIRDRCVEFIQQWFRQKINEYSWQMGDPLIHPDTQVFSKENILKRIQHVFDAYTSFINGHYVIKELRFEWDERSETGLGYMEGSVKYDAVAESGSVVHYEGPFEFYLSNNNAWWSIFYFVFPGFRWRS